MPTLDITLTSRPTQLDIKQSAIRATLAPPLPVTPVTRGLIVELRTLAYAIERGGGALTPALVNLVLRHPDTGRPTPLPGILRTLETEHDYLPSEVVRWLLRLTREGW